MTIFMFSKWAYDEKDNTVTFEKYEFKKTEKIVQRKVHEILPMDVCTAFTVDEFDNNGFTYEKVVLFSNNEVDNL